MIFNTENFSHHPTRVRYVKYILNLLSVFFNERLYTWLPENQSFRISWKDIHVTEIKFQWPHDHEDENILIIMHSYDADLLVGLQGSTLSSLKRFIYTQPGAIKLGLTVDFRIEREVDDPFEIAYQLLLGDEEAQIDINDGQKPKVLISGNTQADTDSISMMQLAISDFDDSTVD